MTVEPTHKNCAQTEADYCGHGLEAAAYPKLDADSCQNLAEAERALAHGLSVSSAVCVGCGFRESCEYREHIDNADTAPHRIATHHRACLSFAEISKGRRYISVHEDAIDLLRPQVETSTGFEQVAELAYRSRKLLQESITTVDHSGEYFFHRLERIATAFVDVLKSADKTAPLPIPAPVAGMPSNVDLMLFRGMEASNIWPNAGALQIAKSLAVGEVAELVVRVDRVFYPGRKEMVKRAVCAVKQTELPGTGFRLSWCRRRTWDCRCWVGN